MNSELLKQMPPPTIQYVHSEAENHSIVFSSSFLESNIISTDPANQRKSTAEEEAKHHRLEVRVISSNKITYIFAGHC